MLEIVYTEKAEQDLVEIGLYTWNEWGEEQYLKYMMLLREICEDILPRSHRLAREVPGRRGMLRWRCERHVIYFRLTDDELEIVRVLHERMLPKKHL